MGPWEVAPRRRHALATAVLGSVALVPSIVLIGAGVSGHAVPRRTLAFIILGYLLVENLGSR